MDVPRFMQFARNYTALRKDKKRVYGSGDTPDGAHAYPAYNVS
ncbi:Hypothetical protein ABZS17G119_00341 [Kosakonia cowanii]